MRDAEETASTDTFVVLVLVVTSSVSLQIMSQMQILNRFYTKGPTRTFGFAHFDTKEF